ncbi:MAG: acetoin utilization protein AcuC [Deltaproteobacteria bacterium]|nr:acetoin utilization protein AcuC [Deltaproteobacteria bacterium]
MTTALVYSDRFGAFHYGADHPMRPARLRLTFDLMSELGLTNLPDAVIIEARQAVEGELLLFHTPEYLRVLREANTGVIPVKGPEHGIGYGDNPAFKGVFEWSCYSTGASIQAAELVASGGADIAFNIAGGLHHAMPGRASGFCYLNDAVVAIRHLVDMGHRVAYVDIDAHHGDGVEYAFYDTNKVLTISLHESGQWLFPGTGLVTDIGIKEGKGFSVNLPFPPGAGDGLFARGFEEIVPAFIGAFRPDVLVTQLGVDTFSTDPITHLNLTTNGFERMVRAFKGFGVPWAALGGGGYDLGNVARAWTLAWAEMNGAAPPETIPEDFILKNGAIFKSDKLRDEPLKPLPDADVRIVEKDIAFLIREVLPMVLGQ